MKRFFVIVICLFLICGAAFYFISLPHNVSEQKAENGVLDITGENYPGTLFNLHGEWEFYFGELIAPESFVGALPKGELINVPMSWSDAGYPLTGCATYRLILKTDLPELLMYVPEINENAVIFINSRIMYEAGRPGRTAVENTPGISNGFISVRPQNGEAEIVIWVSNYEWMYAGLMQTILAGEQNALLPHVITRLAFLAAFIGMLLMMGFYHLVLFFNGRKGRAYLYFSIICLLAAARFFMETNAFAVLFSANGLGAFHYYTYLSVGMLFCGMLGLFTHAALGIPYSKTRRIIYGVTIIGPLLAMFIIPFTVLGTYYALMPLIPSVMSGISALRIKSLRRNPYNALYLIAIMTFVIWGPLTKLAMNDFYFVPGIANNMFLILSQCILLSISYAEAKREAEELAVSNELLSKLSRQKTEFLQDMSHEMRAPLNVIATGIDFADRQIKKESIDISEVSDALDTVRDETQRIGRMITGMVELASMNEISVNRRRTDFAVLLNDCAGVVRVTMEQQDNSLHIEIAPGMPDVFVEGDRFTQVVLNLLNNAAENTDGGRITLSTEYDSAYITVRVSDTGDGIEPELLPRVFERGVSGSGSTGYGLYICKTVVEAHGGTINIESARGEGTTVTFTVPVYGGQAGHRL